ncbi:MAG: hypothetical protein QM820_38975 [Minicystis sp.]
MPSTRMTMGMMTVLTLLGAQLPACSSGTSATGDHGVAGSGGAGSSGSTGTGGTGGTGGSGGSGGSDAGDVPFNGVACDKPSGASHVCDELLSDNLSCDEGSTVLSACPHEGLIGTCLMSVAGHDYKQYFYEGGDIPLDALKGYCAQFGGTWSDP